MPSIGLTIELTIGAMMNLTLGCLLVYNYLSLRKETFATVVDVLPAAGTTLDPKGSTLLPSKKRIVTIFVTALNPSTSPSAPKNSVHRIKGCVGVVVVLLFFRQIEWFQPSDERSVLLCQISIILDLHCTIMSIVTMSYLSKDLLQSWLTAIPSALYSTCLRAFVTWVVSIPTVIAVVSCWVGGALLVITDQLRFTVVYLTGITLWLVWVVNTSISVLFHIRSTLLKAKSMMEPTAHERTCERLNSMMRFYLIGAVVSQLAVLVLLLMILRTRFEASASFAYWWCQTDEQSLNSTLLWWGRMFAVTWITHRYWKLF